VTKKKCYTEKSIENKKDEAVSEEIFLHHVCAAVSVLCGRAGAGQERGQIMKQKDMGNLTGRRYGKLTVCFPTGEYKNQSRVWRCKCDCGNFVDVTTRDLNRGAVKSCGCLRHRPPENSHSIKNNLHFVEGTCVENLIASQKRPVKSSTGIRGVYWQSRRRIYVATIGFKGKTHYLGQYRSLEEAARARRAAEHEYYDNFLSNYFLSEAR